MSFNLNFFIEIKKKLHYSPKVFDRQYKKLVFKRSYLFSDICFYTLVHYLYLIKVSLYKCF